MRYFKASTITIHLVAWLLFLILPFLFMRGQSEESAVLSFFLWPYYWQFILCYVCLFYLHTYVVFPRLFLQKKYILYCLSVLALLVSVYLIKPFDDLLRHQPNQLSEQSQTDIRPVIPAPHTSASPPKDGNFPPDFWSNSRPPSRGHRPRGEPPFRPGPGRRPVDITSLFIACMMLALGTAASTLHEWQTTQKRAVQAEADKANAELSFLKAQINPHFLFNTLNNIYSLAITNNENTATSIMKLSNIMRYVTNDAGQDFVLLQQEVDCIEDYLDLQRLRLSQHTKLAVSIEGDLENKQIAPLILMTFVENVFKYGISNHEPSVITITLEATENTIHFFCQNTIFSHPISSERAGIGLSNTRKRLAYLYPDKHTLTITEANKLFTVDLLLQIEP
jgi:uncharacterized membrane-anchored protein YhcB (DUF1043 family)